MSIKRYAAVGLVLSLFANAAFGAGVRMFKFDETPDPREVAKVLSYSSPPPGLKMRSIRMLPAAPEEKPGESPPLAETSKESGISNSGAVVVATAPTSTAIDAAPAPTTVAPAKGTVSSPKMEDQPSSLALPVQFAFDSALILPDAYRQLDALAAGIKLAGPSVKVLIEGHTDAVGSAQYNLRLSSQRADSVRIYLITRHGIDPARLRVVGMGKYAPLNKTTPNAPENRRVEFRAEV